jgi:hypothetical protein
MSQKTLVIVPTYNERDNLPPLVDKLMHLPVPVEVLVVDDNRVNQRLLEHRVTQTAKRAAYAAILAEADAANVELAALRTAATQPPPAHPPAGAPKKKASKKNNLPVRLTARALLPGAPAWYCHSCGTDFQLGYEHHSYECRDRLPGHQKHASYVNQMGGKRA